ncbi:hypothetical protein EJB05_23308 [Eragrostis curvula]|uniref:VAN3-binding protein-like auxin canalisation domain-containing protein n=1 Tax=Eragrostis curvula TaxID=38414 RepID=A0A5J9V6N7_9POAL|nr:hypothetical protein EJB05_23308 [Eragrostis curvula]
MEHFKRGVEFGMASFQRCHSLSCQAESTPIDAPKAALRCKEKSRRSKCCHPAEVPVIPEQAMEFLSRTWSPSSLDLFQILSPSSLGSSSEDHEPDQAGGDKDEDEEKNLDTARTNNGETSQLFNQAWGVVASGKPGSTQRMHKISQPTWLNVGHMKTMLRGFFLDSVPVTGSRRRRRRDELRLHSAQAHAAVSVAQLAAAVAGIVSVCELKPAAAASDKRLGPVLASAAALVATVCAEAAETAGANRGRVTSAVRNGLDSRSSAELLTLTATAATCLRGAAALKLRAADLRGISSGGGSSNAGMAMSISAGIQKGTTLRVCLPCGRVCVRTVAVFPQRGAVALRLGKKRLRGAFATYKDYEVASVGDGGNCGEAVVEGRPAFPVVVATAEGATVRLLFEHQTHCKVWKASIEGMLSEQRLKRANTN